MRTSLLVVAMLVCSAEAIRLDAADPSLLEATVDGKTFRGKLVGKDAKICWLMDRDGRMARLDINKIDKIEAKAPTFRPYTIAELRDLIRREYGKEFETVGSGKYI